MQVDYGDLCLVVIKSGDDFCSLLDALEDDKSGFILHNKPWIMEKYRDGQLYGLCVKETDAMCQRHAWNDSIFLKGASWYTLPCFCTILDDEHPFTAQMIWVHSKARRLGLGKALVDLLAIDSVYCPQPESLAFWEACGISCS
jgi:ribosomal protein S18 acetylase RimI-like enzyme